MRGARFNSTGFVASYTPFTRAMWLVSVFGYHRGLANGWIHLHETDSLVGGEVPLDVIPAFAQDSFSFIISGTGVPFERLTIALSTSESTYTPGAADLLILGTTLP